MKINHLNLPVPDVAATRRFFEDYFGFTTRETKGDNMLSVLEDEAGFSLVIMAQSFNRNGNTTYPDAQHIGFLVATIEEVNRIYERLLTSDVALPQAPSNMRGVFGFYFHAPGNILTEISCAQN